MVTGAVPVRCLPLELDRGADHLDGGRAARFAWLLPRVLGGDLGRDGAEFADAGLVLGRDAKLVLVALKQVGDRTRQSRHGFFVDADPPAARRLSLHVVPDHRRAAVAERWLIRHRAGGAQYVVYRHCFRRSRNRCHATSE